MKKTLQKKTKVIISTFALSFLCYFGFTQEYRTFNGSGNNLNSPEWGAAGTNLLRITTNGFSDKIAAPAGEDRPNPRVISNEIFDQGGMLLDTRYLSDYTWVWGQFIDHDVSLTPNHAVESSNISVPAGDRFFDPYSTGTAIIPMNRSVFDLASGTDSTNPRAFPNMITAFIDGSGVYGSDQQRAKWLRTFRNGKLKTASGGFLPFNTLDGSYTVLLDITAPEMDMPFPRTFIYAVAGDIRANENPLLSTVHTIFVREHNRLCDSLRVANPEYNDEQLYQKARRIVGALIQAVVYEEWLPTLGVHLQPYSGYKPDVDPGIMNVFSAAAYRYGHSVINSSIMRLDKDGDVIPQGNILLRDAFFDPTVIAKGGGLEPLLRGMAVQVEQDFDCKIVDDLRNFLFGPPGAGGLDLAAININRGRDRGLPNYNTVRTDIGLPRVESFFSMTSNPWLNQALERVYGDISKVDPWVGFLAEDHMPDALFGETVMAIMKMQFTALRDGDRFYYENDPDLSIDEKAEIKNTRFSDIIMRNSNIEYMQDNVFISQQLSTAVVDNSSEVEFDIFPNPASSVFYTQISSDENLEAEFRIYDQLGRSVKSKKWELRDGFQSLEWRVDSEMPTGVYNIVCQAGGKIGTRKLLVVR